MELGPEVLRGLSGSPHDFLWLVVFGAIICFLTAFAIGANDVANTFSSSVGSRAIPLPVAIGMAAVLETAGATLLGAAVTDSIRSKIIDFATFEAQPSVLMLGMLCSLLGAGLWLFLANRFGLPQNNRNRAAEEAQAVVAAEPLSDPLDLSQSQQEKEHFPVGMEENEFVERLQNDVEMFDVETEIFFSACQVVSACMGCIAHSANDTANAVGPFAAILTIYQHGIRSSVTCPWYILLFGGLAMSLGLALLGYRVIKTVGVKLVKITPARGFSMELGAAWWGVPWVLEF
ncbi:hypothetical protein Emed_005871 [Eimeria media]